MRRVARVLLLMALAAVALAACGRPVGERTRGDVRGRLIRAVATTGMVADAVQHIGGERVQVTALMGPGVDPHLYKASAGDVERLLMADIVFYNGLHLEAAMGKVFERMGGRVTSVAVGDGIDPALLLPSDVYENQHDPHVWFDVRLWQQAAGRVRDALIDLDPASAALYRANAARYLGELHALDSYVRAQAETVPASQRVLITAHDAFRYFGRAYGFEVRGLQGISTASEAGTADVQALAAFIAERQIAAIFVESSVPQRTVEAVQAAVRARGFEVAIGGQLFSDAMGTPGTPEGSYVGMVRHNIDTIVGALRQG